MVSDYKPKTALITGASRGIGAECARALSRCGYRVIINYLGSEAAAMALARETGGIPVQGDVSVDKEAAALVAASGEIDVLVCCAGEALIKQFQDTTAEEWRHIFAVNVEGTVNVCRAAIPAMIRRKSGVIITISSVWGLTGSSCETAYSASKAAVIGLTKALAKEFGPSGIRVNCIAPGVICTDMNKDLTPDALAAIKEETPLGTLGCPEDVAALVSFLASDGARFITGQVIGTNGGLVI